MENEMNVMVADEAKVSNTADYEVVRKQKHNAGSADYVVIRSRIKDIAGTFSVSKDFADALDIKIINILIRAKERAKLNQRTTIMPRDI